MTAVAYFYAYAPRWFFPLLNGGELAVLYCFVYLSRDPGFRCLNRRFIRRCRRRCFVLNEGDDRVRSRHHRGKVVALGRVPQSPAQGEDSTRSDIGFQATNITGLPVIEAQRSGALADDCRIGVHVWHLARIDL
jgi:hypothetical protein